MATRDDLRAFCRAAEAAGYAFELPECVRVRLVESSPFAAPTASDFVRIDAALDAPGIRRGDAHEDCNDSGCDRHAPTIALPLASHEVPR